MTTSSPSTLVGWWDLAADGRDRSGHGHHAAARGEVAFGPSHTPGRHGPVARIVNGRGHLDVPGFRAIGTSDFTVTLWFNADVDPTAALGDLVSTFDPDERRGFNVGFQHRAVCGSHVNDRNLFFGLDAGSEPRWTDHGSPAASAVMIYALAAFDGELYAATWQESNDPLGHVYRLDGGDWVDCGVPWGSNAVTRLAVHDGDLYAGVSRIKGGGSGLPESTNQTPGGRILRYEGGTRWSDRGQLEGANSVGALVPFGGSLYSTPLYSQGVFRLSAPDSWAWCGTPGRRLLALGVHDGNLYGAGNDHADVEAAIRLTAAGVVVPARSDAGGGGVFRYDGGEGWTDCGMQPDTTQIYSFETHGGKLLISSWPTGLVFRLGEDGAWQNTGRLGQETEVMPLVSYNGMLYAGTLPGAEVFRLDSGGSWTSLKAIDTTPDVMYRRAHAMCVYRGDLFCGSLPSANVSSLRAGLAVSYDRAVGPGWHHLAVVRGANQIAMYLDGDLVADRTDDGQAALDLGAGSSMRLGSGPQAGMAGELADVRFYLERLDQAAIARVANSS